MILVLLIKHFKILFDYFITFSENVMKAYHFQRVSGSDIPLKKSLSYWAHIGFRYSPIRSHFWMKYNIIKMEIYKF